MGKAFFFNLMGTGHVNPTLGVVTELVRRGEQIIYYAFDEHRNAIVASGAEFRSYPIALPTIERRESGLHLALHKLEQSLVALPQLLEIMTNEQADYVLFDAMAPLGPFIAQKLGIPAISSNSSFAFTPEVIRAFTPPHLSPDTMIERVTGVSGSHHLEQYAAVAAEIKSKYDLDAPAWLEVLTLAGDLTLLYTSGDIQPADHLGSNYKLVGPCFRQSTPVADFPYDLLQRDNLIYISLGTEFHNNTDFYRRCIEALNDTNYTVLLCIGRDVAIAELGTVAPNITITRFAPQLEVLQTAQVFVTHGGMNSTNEALYYNVPLALVPQGADQFLVTQQVVANGAGIALDSQNITSEQLRHTIEQLLTIPSYRQNATRMGASLRTLGGASAAAEAVLQCVAHHRNIELGHGIRA